MSIVTTKRARKQPVRTMRLMDTCEGKLLRIENGNALTYYRLTSLASHFGKAYRLQKVVTGHEVYDVLLDGGRSTCECKGFLRHGHCKHTDGLTVLCRRGMI